MVESHKHLGLTLNSNAKWAEHINTISKSGSILLHEKIKNSLLNKTYFNIYISFATSTLTLSQTTNFRPFQTERVCSQQF